MSHKVWAASGDNARCRKLEPGLQAFIAVVEKRLGIGFQSRNPVLCEASIRKGAATFRPLP